LEFTHCGYIVHRLKKRRLKKMSYPANSLTDPSLAVPFEGKGLDPNDRKVSINARDGTIIAEKLVLRGSITCDGLATSSGKNIEKYLNNSHFSSGTLRIVQSGTYRLVENIVFNPSLNRSDLPVNGFWFAAISVEANDVIIEGDGYDIRLSDEFAAINPANIYCAILLGNNVFAGALFGVNGSRYPDTSAYVPCNNVRINNLKVSYSSHFGVRGSNNTSVTITGCSFENCLITGVALQGSVDLIVDNCKFKGATIPAPSIAEQTLLLLLRQTLQVMITNNVSGAVAELASLNAWVAANPSRFIPNEPFPGSQYGIFVSSGATAVFRVPMNSATNAVSQVFGGGRECQNVKIINCNFRDFTVSARERVSVGTNLPQPPNSPPFPGIPLVVLPLSFLGAFSQLDWRDVFPAGVFAPNAFAHAITFVANWVYPQLSPGQQGLIPSNTPQIITSVLTGNQVLFNANAAPIVGQNDQIIKGLFGIRAVGVVNLLVDNVFMENFQSIGPSAVDPTTLPGYGSVTPQPIVRNRQNDVWFMSAEVCENVKVSNSYWDGLTSNHGWVFGISNDENHNFLVDNSLMENMAAGGLATSVVEPAGKVFVYTADNIIAGNTFLNATTTSISAADSVQAFPVVTDVPTTVNGNQNLTVAPFTLTVASTVGFPDNGLISVVTTHTSPLKIVRYSGITPTTFTGCVATGSFSTLNGSAVKQTGVVLTNCFEL
jgi:hypothetical protein